MKIPTPKRDSTLASHKEAPNRAMVRQCAADSATARPGLAVVGLQNATTCIVCYNSLDIV